MAMFTSSKTTVLSPEKIHELISAASKVRSQAYVPYSNFRVGAALLASDGTIFTGCNVENAAYSPGICAERTALVKAISEGQRTFLALAVTSQIPGPDCSPCGVCRQVIREFFAPEIPIFMVGSSYPVDGEIPGFVREYLERGSLKGEERDMVVRTMEELLPLSFGPEHLGMERK